MIERRASFELLFLWFGVPFSGRSLCCAVANKVSHSLLTTVALLGVGRIFTSFVSLRSCLERLETEIK